MTDERSPFERQLSARLERMAGPEPYVDVDASVRAAITPAPKWRFPRMFSAAKLFLAGAVVAAFGGYLLVAAVDRSGDGIVPGAESVGASCPEAAALLEARESGSTADASIVSRVQIEPFGEDEAADDAAIIDESDGYARMSFPIEGIPIEADDGRLDGLFSGQITVRFFTDDAGYMDGSVRIENEAGSWTGQVSAFAGGGGDAMHFELVGGGAYSGCAVFLNGEWDAPLSGVVYPAPAITEA